MANFESAKQALLRRLQSEAPQVILLNGRWGVGKSHLWTMLRAEYRGLRKSAFASAFGVCSSQQLLGRLAISFAEDQQALAGFRASLQRIAQGLQAVFNAASEKYIGIGLPESVVSEAFALALKNQIVVIDDLERRDNAFSLENLFGFVHQLRSESNNTVVLIANIDELLEEDRETLSKWREKLFDFEVTLVPTHEEAVQAGLVRRDSANICRKALLATKTTNIRIVERIADSWRDFQTLAGPIRSDLLELAAHSFVLLSYCKYGAGEGAPSLKYVETIGFKHYGFENEKLTELERSWNSFISEFGWQETDSLDVQMIRFLTEGVCDQGALAAAIQESLNNLDVAKKETNSRSAWKVFHKDFAENQPEFVSRFTDAVVANSKFESIHNTDGAIRLLRELGEADRANRVLQAYISAHAGNPERFDLSRDVFGDSVKDPEFLAACMKEVEASVSSKPRPDILALLNRIAKNKSWGGEDRVLLHSLSVDDWEREFKRTDGDESVGVAARAAIGFGRFQNSDTMDREIAARATEALQRIGASCPLNRARVARLGIQVGTNPTAGSARSVDAEE